VLPRLSWNADFLPDREIGREGNRFVKSFTNTPYFFAHCIKEEKSSVWPAGITVESPKNRGGDFDYKTSGRGVSDEGKSLGPLRG
jgi:hypothetical protein